MSPSLLNQCCTCLFCELFHILFTISSDSYQMYTHTLILPLFQFIWSIIFFAVIIWRNDILFYNDYKTSRQHTTMSTLVFISLFIFQQFYWISAVFLQLVVYFISYLWLENFHIRTHTHNFMFTLFLLIWYIIFLPWLFKAIINIVKTIELF